MSIVTNTCSSVTDNTVAPAARISSRNRRGETGSLPSRCLSATSQMLATETAHGEVRFRLLLTFLFKLFTSGCVFQQLSIVRLGQPGQAGRPVDDSDPSVFVAFALAARSSFKTRSRPAGAKAGPQYSNS